MNKVLLIGTLGKDAEIRFSQNGMAFLKLSVATKSEYKIKDEKTWEVTEWHRITAFGKLAEKYADLKIGNYVFIEGRIKTDSWEKNGEKKYSTGIIAERIKLLIGNSNPEKTNDTTIELQDDYVPF